MLIFRHLEFKIIKYHNHNGGEKELKQIRALINKETFIFDTAGPFFSPNDYGFIFAILAFLQSKVASFYLRLLNPTINFPPGYVEALP